MDKLLTMNIDEEKLESIDQWWKQHGFANRSEFIKFACSSVMDAHDEDSYLLVQEKYYHWLLKSAMEKVSNDIARNIKSDLDTMKSALFNKLLQRFKGEEE